MPASSDRTACYVTLVSFPVILGILCLVTGVGWAYCRWSWSRYRSDLSVCDVFLSRVAKAQDGTEERKALADLAAWRHILLIGAYDRTSGRAIPISVAIDRAGNESVFALGFDLDHDGKTERTFYVVLKDPMAITELMRE